MQIKHVSIWSNRDVARRDGFTLVEVLLALAISVSLLAVIYTGLEIYRGLTTAGQSQVERAKLARAILNSIAQDIRSVDFNPPRSGGLAGEATSGTDGSTSNQGTGTEGGTGSAQETAVAVVDPAEAYFGSNVGVLGDMSTLVLHVSRPNRGLPSPGAATNSPSTLRLSDMQSVSYFIAEDGADGLRGLVAADAAPGGMLGLQTRGIRGLARLEGDRLSTTMADQMNNLDLLATQAEIIAPEVNLLVLEYFDGFAWYDTWDSVAFGELPKAIRIIVGFPPSEEIPEETAGNAESVIVEHYELIVPVPRSNPEPYLP